jgi:hypothetical protein
MNIMKKFNLLFFCLYVILSACHAEALSDIKWMPNGTIITPDGKKHTLDIQSAYDGMTYLDTTYIAGFKINKDGINIPTLSVINSNLSAIKYWTFENSINDIFVYKNSVHVSDSRGNVYLFANEAWQKDELAFPVAAKVIFSDQHNQIIVCSPASLLKEGSSDSGCYSINANWKYSFFWQHTTPKVCSGKLHIFEESRTGGMLRVLSIKTGDILFSKKIKTAPKNICEIKSF